MHVIPYYICNTEVTGEDTYSYILGSYTRALLNQCTYLITYVKLKVIPHYICNIDITCMKPNPRD